MSEEHALEQKETRVAHEVSLAHTRDESGEVSEQPKIVGYAAVYNSLSQDLGGFKEKITRGAFA